jgi:hypothetical protein
VQVLDDERHAGFPGTAGQAEPARELGVPGIELEHIGGAVIAVDQAHLVGDFRIVVPEFGSADVLFVFAAEQHHHGHQVSQDSAMTCTWQARSSRGRARQAAGNRRTPFAQIVI